MQLLSKDRVDRLLSTSLWRARDDKAAIAREFSFPDFSAALAFVNRVGDLAERCEHHPDILLYSWNRVLLTLSTHSEGGLTDRDFTLAEQIDSLHESEFS